MKKYKVKVSVWRWGTWDKDDDFAFAVNEGDVENAVSIAADYLESHYYDGDISDFECEIDGNYITFKLPNEVHEYYVEVEEVGD